MNWPNRNPMAFMQFQTWLNDPAVANAKTDKDATTALMFHVSQNIPFLRKMNTQIVFWCDQGEPDNQHYIGDPRIEFPPITRPVKQAVYKMYIQAGFKVACTIRPGIPTLRPGGSWVAGQYDRVAGQTLSDDVGAKCAVAYADGVRAFYLDSNIDQFTSNAFDPRLFDQLRIGGFGDDCLFFPEYTSPANAINPTQPAPVPFWDEADYYARTSRSMTAEMIDANGNYIPLPTLVFPAGGFACFRPFTKIQDPARLGEFTEMIKRGHIFMFLGQGSINDPGNALVYKAYQAAGVAGF